MKNDHEVLDKLNIKVRKVIKRFSRKGYIFVHGELNRRDVLVKVVPRSDAGKSFGIYKEAIVDNIIEKHNKDLINPLINSTKVLSSGSDEKYVWIIRRYYEGRSLAKYKENHILMGYDILDRKYLLNRKKILIQIVENLESLKTIKKDFRKLGLKKDFFKHRYENDLEKYYIKAIENGLNSDLSKIIDFYNKHKSDYFNKENIQACMGDLVPANIILRNNNMILLSDFEFFCFDNYTFDIASLWMFLWRYPDWQRDLIKLMIKNDKDRTFFRLSLARQIIGWYSFIYDPTKNKNEKMVEKMTKHKSHIWTKYLIAAGESFEALMKVKK